MTEPKFQPVDLTELQDAGVLMMVNEKILWPLGLALTWDHDKDTGKASNLHVRQWVFEDGHVEAIGADYNDPVFEQRRAAYSTWLNERLSKMPIVEALAAGPQDWVYEDEGFGGT